jgi:hypothetical protein
MEATSEPVVVQKQQQQQPSKKPAIPVTKQALNAIPPSKPASIPIPVVTSSTSTTTTPKPPIPIIETEPSNQTATTPPAKRQLDDEMFVEDSFIIGKVPVLV